MAENSAWSWQGDSLVLSCHLQPGAKRSEFAGLHGTDIKIRIAAPPVEGKANTALIAFLADQFGVRKNEITIVAGELSRHKRVAIHAPRLKPEIPGLIIPYKIQQKS